MITGILALAILSATRQPSDTPVSNGLVEKAEDWMYSSQQNNSGLERLIEIDLADF